MKQPQEEKAPAEFAIKKIPFGWAITKEFYVIALCPTKAWAEKVVAALTAKV